MVNVAGRSKGCLPCRKRKIKCDECHPACLQCTKAGLRCPGPRTGAFFVHTLPKAPLPYEPLAKHSSAELEPREAGPQVGSNYLPSLPNYIQPCRAEIFDQLFVSHFIESFGFNGSATDSSTSSTWLDQLATFISSPSHSLVKHSIRAGSMVFYGTLAHDVSICTEASKWYLKALQGLQQQLSRPNSAFAEDMICSVVMLTHFENMAGTSAGAWFQHVQGAATLLEARGAESCRDGFLHQLFRHLRLLAFIASIFQNQEHVFSSRQWITVPFELHSKSAFDYFVDILLSLLPCLALANKIIELESENANVLKIRLHELLTTVLTQLYLWWARCVSTPNFIQEDSAIWAWTPCEQSIDFFGDPEHVPLLPHYDIPTATLVALYDAVNIIAFRLWSLIHPFDQKHEERIQQHVKSILSAKKFIMEMPGPASGRGSVIMGFPLKILSIWGPSNKIHMTRNLFPGQDNQGSDATDLSAGSNMLFGNVASYVLQICKYQVPANKMNI